VTQTAAAWVLGCVFVRFLEDNRLIDPPKIAGPGEQLRRARDEHELYFRAHPVETDREYLLQVFDALAKWSGMADLFGEHNPIHELPHWLSGDAAGDLLTFFQRIDANTGALVIAWAGYDHLQLARAISTYYVDIQERLGGSDDPRLVPLRGGLMELLPWLKQWHNDVDPEFGMQMGDYFEGFIQEEARQMGKTIDEIKAWEPIKKAVRRRKKRA
jgi:hypothetical protein